MIDDKKIEAAAEEYNEKVENELEKKHIPKRTFAERYAESAISECAFKAGAKWAICELLNDLLRPASEVPRNDNGKILAFSKANSNMNAMLNETACYTYQGKQEVRVREYTFTDLAFVEDLLDLIKKGGNHD